MNSWSPGKIPLRRLYFAADSGVQEHTRFPFDSIVLIGKTSGCGVTCLFYTPEPDAPAEHAANKVWIQVLLCEGAEAYKRCDERDHNGLTEVLGALKGTAGQGRFSIVRTICLLSLLEIFF